MGRIVRQVLATRGGNVVSAKTGNRKGVDWGLLDDVEAGDVLQIHFTPDSIGDVGHLIRMIDAGKLTSPDEMMLHAIWESSDWGGGPNRYVEISPTDTFDRTWFEGRMDRRIDKLEVKSRRRPLVDMSALDLPGVSIRYRFKPDGLNGVTEMLELHEMEVLRLGAADLLRAAMDAGVWGESSPSPRIGHFINRLVGDNNEQEREYFVTHVVPNLELLRS